MTKEPQPTNAMLNKALAATYPLWQTIENYVMEQYPKGMGEWNFPGKNYGWSYRIKDKKRAIIYLLPRNGSFKVAFVFGQKAYDAIMESSISESIKTELSQARKYAEGRGIRIEIMQNTDLQDIFKLIAIKLRF